MFHEMHPNPNEYFPQKGTLGSPGGFAKAAALIASMASAAAVLTILALSIVCTPLSILPESARIEVETANREDCTILWFLTPDIPEETPPAERLDSGTQDQDRLVLALDGLTPGTGYSLWFCDAAEPETILLRYDFRTPGSPVPTEPPTEPPPTTLPPTEAPTEPTTEPVTEPPTEPTTVPTTEPIEYFQVTCTGYCTFSGGDFSGAASGSVPAGTVITVSCTVSQNACDFFINGAYQYTDWTTRSISITVNADTTILCTLQTVQEEVEEFPGGGFFEETRPPATDPVGGEVLQ